MDSLINFLAVTLVFFVILKSLGNILGKSEEAEEFDEADETLEGEGLEEPVRRMLLENPPRGFLYEPDQKKRRQILEEYVNKYMIEESRKMKLNISEEEKQAMIYELIDDMMGFGPIQKFLDDKDVVEIRVEGHQVVKVSDGNQQKETQVKFKDRKHLLDVIERIFSAHDQRLTAATPRIEGSLPDGAIATAWFADATPQSEAFLTIKKSI
ncbi:MAG: hypothetical protein ACOYXC_21835 [Candidatus Rifleibacteriota bacterium]